MTNRSNNVGRNDRMNSNTLDTLKLVAPWNLPVNLQLSVDERQKVKTAICLFKSALETEDVGSALKMVNELLATVDDPTTQPCTKPSEKQLLNSKEIEVYDQYFGVKHVTSSFPPMTLIRSLAETCRAFLLVRLQHQQLDTRQVELQRAGYLCHTNLLERVFNLEETE